MAAGDDCDHASSVVCLDFPGDAATKWDCIERGGGALRVLAFFAGSGDGEGPAGELMRSSMSIVPSGGGVKGRSCDTDKSAGRVRDRCIGAHCLLLVTLEGSSSWIGDIEDTFACGSAAFAGDEDGRSTIVLLASLVGGEDAV